MLKPEILKAKPAPDYDNLKRQFFALKTLCESKMHQCQIYSQKLAEYDRELLISSIEEINSQREMNAILTQENEQLRAENEKLPQQAEKIRALESQINDLLELIYNSAEGEICMGYKADIENMAQVAYAITGINAGQLRKS